MTTDAETEVLYFLYRPGVAPLSQPSVRGIRRDLPEHALDILVELVGESIMVFTDDQGSYFVYPSEPIPSSD